MEVFFHRKPDEEEIEPLLGRIRQFCTEGTKKRQEVADLALLILSDATPGETMPHQEPGEPAAHRLGAVL